MSNEQSIRDAATEWIAGLISGNGFGDDYVDDEVKQWADDLLSSDLVRRIRREAQTEPTPFNGKWICGKCAREVAQCAVDGQIPEHHRTCHKRAQIEPTDAQIAAMTDPNSITDGQADAALLAHYRFVFGEEGLPNQRELGIGRQAMKVAISEAVRAALTAGQEDKP